MIELNVDLYGQSIGTLSGDRREFDFVAHSEAIARYGIGSSALSFSAPFTTAPRADMVSRRRNFFEEILAEGPARKRLADIAKVDETNTMMLLKRYGRDVAGAIQIWDAEDASEPRNPTAVAASSARIRELLELVKKAPIGNATVRHMSSLAGMQDKIVLAKVDGQWAEALDGYPSTHIVKPIVGIMPSLIGDEEFGAQIARHLGLANFETHLDTFEGLSALVIERYDRDASGRIHQEDFNQALGLHGDQKYELYGNAGLVDVSRVLRDSIGNSALRRLLTMTTLSLAVGNLDMHVKNISVLHVKTGAVELAPMYDVVPQTHLSFDNNFAFKINGVEDHADITREDIIMEAKKWGLRSPESIIDETIDSIREFAATHKPHPSAHPELAQDIQRFAANLMAGRGAGAAPGQQRSIPRPPRARGDAEGGWGGPSRR